MDTAVAVSCTSGQMWLSVFVGSGVMISMVFELLHLHAGPAKQESFLLVFCCYMAQLLIGGAWVLGRHSWQRGVWTRPMVGALLLSSVCNGLAQALDYISLNQSGIQLYTILHSMVTLFAVAIAFVLLRVRISAGQWVAVLAVVTGLVLTGVPTPADAQGNFVLASVSGAAGALCLAASYPLAELVFKLAPRGTMPPSEEACAFSGALLNVLVFGTWTLAFTVPRWTELVLDPIRDASYPAPTAVVTLLYFAFAALVGVHTLAFWKTMPALGTVPLAVSKGAQQSLTFVLAHVLFCHGNEHDDGEHLFRGDPHQCMTSVQNGNASGHGGGVAHASSWSHMQKPLSFVVCCFGCVFYAVLKRPPPKRRLAPASGAAATAEAVLVVESAPTTLSD